MAHTYDPTGPGNLPAPVALADLMQIHERHLLALSVLGHRTAPDGTLPADAVADLAELLWGGR